MATKAALAPLIGTNPGPRPADFPLGSVESRAAARALLLARAEYAEKPLRIVVTGLGWEMTPDGAAHMPALDLAKSTCMRTRLTDNQCMELVQIYGNWTNLNEGDLEKWIASFPIQ